MRGRLNNGPQGFLSPMKKGWDELLHFSDEETKNNLILGKDQFTSGVLWEQAHRWPQALQRAKEKVLPFTYLHAATFTSNVCSEILVVC